MSESRSAQRVPPVVRDRIREDDSIIVEKIIVLLIVFWLGGLALVTVSATGSFRAVDASLDKPSATVVKSMARLGIAETRALLHDQSSEVNRQLFEVWGWVQLGLTGSILAALLFMTNTGKQAIGLAAGMAGFSALMAGVLIPGMIRIGREMRAGPNPPTPDMAQSFKNMHQAFGAFEIATVVLAAFLFAKLVRRGAGSRR